MCQNQEGVQTLRFISQVILVEDTQSLPRIVCLVVSQLHCHQLCDSRIQYPHILFMLHPQGWRIRPSGSRGKECEYDLSPYIDLNCRYFVRGCSFSQGSWIVECRFINLAHWKVSWHDVLYLIPLLFCYLPTLRCSLLKMEAQTKVPSLDWWLEELSSQQW